MPLYHWFYSVYPPNAEINGRYGTLHIAVMVGIVAACVAIGFLRNKEDARRRWVLYALALCILLFEETRRIINLTRGPCSVLGFVQIMVPRPWCAISCWLTMAAVLVHKRWFYNFCTMNSLLCAIVFFAYPNVGFNHSVILFENVYSIVTHGLLLLSAVSMITLRFADFRLEPAQLRKTAAMLAGMFAYATLEILLGIESDPLMFLPGSEVQDFLGVSYPLFLVIYIVFLAVWFSSFYLVQWLCTRKKQAAPLS